MKDKQLSSFLLWAFLLAWALQAVAIGLAWNGQTHYFQLALLVSMYAPFAAVLLAKAPRDMGWSLKLRHKGKWVLAAWFGFAVLAVLGAAVYFLLFPKAFDPGFGFLAAQLGEEGLRQMEAQGLTLETLVLIQLVEALTYAPLINTFAALGEEVGWRGFLYPRLKARFGTAKGRLLGGAIWGVWHWPVMILAGYNYGSDYWGAPVLGPLLFCAVCVALGTIIDDLYEKTGCIWVPALAHGAFNAVSGLGVLVLNPAYITHTTLGPAPIGLIGGLPLFALALLLLAKSGKATEKQKTAGNE